MTEMGLSDDQMAKAEDIYSRHARDLARFATVLVGPDDANDVVSSAVIRVLERDLGEIENPRAYLFRAVSNEARNLRRRESRRRSREDRSGLNPVTYLPEPHPEIRVAVLDLSVRQRAVVYLTYWEDMTDQRIADHLGISAGSVRRHLARARNHLRRILHET